MYEKSNSIMSVFNINHYRNVLAHGHIRGALDIKQLALLVRNADYKPRVCNDISSKRLTCFRLQGFGACVIRFTNPRCSLMVYKSGKVWVIYYTTRITLTIWKVCGIGCKSSSSCAYNCRSIFNCTRGEILLTSEIQNYSISKWV